jgi:hypothetical protein
MARAFGFLTPLSLRATSTLRLLLQGRLFTVDDRTGIVFEIHQAESGEYRVAPKFVSA